MNLELRHLRALVAVAEVQTFTDAAIALGTSQASVSRSVAALERALGVRVFQRTTRSVTPTATGKRIIEHARRVLDEARLLEDAARDASGELRVGYAWSAVGSRTLAVQRRWEGSNPAVPLVWVQSGSPAAGLANGTVDVAVVRKQLNDPRFAETLIGTERRYAAVAATDPLARRRFLRMADFAGRALAVDSRTGTTSVDLWSPEAQPASLRPVQGVDDWLTLISTGRAMGMSSEATAAQYPRPGVAYKVVRDAPPISVFLAYWKDDPSVLIAEFARLARQAYDDGG
ncbi:LysR family transcriptional regulator [Arthrobacter sp. ISL-65]|uniref:LysR family transcriptional regulator n=1 Tax=Arthrobacter sp. ISL-65 TaxID=2819112 RepID=UPI001BEAA326|nr:LysR family transcriptional regulator [Arthrobacter sp. ISL-65]MBT2547670.1 LysR family transcriptional regulator [Arthrobacter sp. ISL-65]